MLQSIQLNVNDPHFLIMQGKIAKTVNLKPKEMLAMIEESSGTKIYEIKRSYTMKMLEKKITKGMEHLRITFTI